MKNETQPDPDALADAMGREIVEEETALAQERAQDIRQAAAMMGRKGGKAKSEAKARASRENGKRGGRKLSVQFGDVAIGEPYRINPTATSQEKGRE